MRSARTTVLSPKIKHFSVKSELNKAALLDAGLKELIRLYGCPKARRRAPGFQTLARIIIAQQLSTTAAAAIWDKLEKDCNGEVTPRKIRNRSQRRLQSCGLSVRKAEYLTGLSEKFLSEERNFQSLAAKSDDEIVKQLTEIRGMGVWSAEIYCLFALARRDIYPAGDLALQAAIQKYARLKSRPDEKQTRIYAQRWSPHRSAVALLMWKYYGAATLG